MLRFAPLDATASRAIAAASNGLDARAARAQEAFLEPRFETRAGSSSLSSVRSRSRSRASLAGVPEGERAVALASSVALNPATYRRARRARSSGSSLASALARSKSPTLPAGSHAGRHCIGHAQLDDGAAPATAVELSSLIGGDRHQPRAKATRVAQAAQACATRSARPPAPLRRRCRGRRGSRSRRASCRRGGLG